MMGEVVTVEVSSIILMLVGLTIVINAVDLVRVLIGLELMFNSIFVMLAALYVYNPALATLITLISVTTSAAEFMALITLVITIDRVKRTIAVSSIRAGGDKP